MPTHPSLRIATKTRRISYGNGRLRLFEKAPRSIVCPHFWLLRWAWGCPFQCSYCYLQGTFHGNKAPHFERPVHILRTLEEAFSDEMFEPSIINSGELADSLMTPSSYDKRFGAITIEEIADKFEEQEKHKLLLLTKSNDVKFLLNKPRKQTIVSFSFNALKVAKRWEKGAAPVEKRIEAAKLVKEAGYETRIRIDPMIPIKGWEGHYCDLVDKIFNSFEPSRITLGTLRGLQKTIIYSNDKSWTRYLSEEETGWGKKVGFALRLSMYSVVSNYLKEKYGFSKIALCKETPEIWRKLGMDPRESPTWKNCKCNCVW